LRHLLPLLSPSFVPTTTGKIIKKVSSDLDFYLPFRQHAPSLANARQKIYADVDQFPGEDGAGFFNILAFRGVFFGSPFAQSDRYLRFNTFSDWEKFQVEESEVAKKLGEDGEEEKYYVKRSCYGRSQKDRSTQLLSKYWDQRQQWSAKFNRPTKPTITEVHKWLKSSLFPNIGGLSALLICGDLIEAGMLPMPTAHEWGGLIFSLDMGAKDGMEMLGLIKKKAGREEVMEAFVSLNLALQQELKEAEKVEMCYNVVMLEHALCKIKRLTTRGITLSNILREI
jgi:hypothetical protein